MNDVQRFSVTCSPAALLDMANTPILLAPAPGPGLIWVPLRVFFYLDAGGTPYTHANPLTTYLGTQPTYSYFDATGSILANAADTLEYAVLAQLHGSPPSAVINQPMYVSSPSNPTLGDGTLQVTADLIAVPVIPPV